MSKPPTPPETGPAPTGEGKYGWILPLLGLYLAAFVLGYLLSLIRMPLPWMIGGMVCGTAVVLIGWRVRVPTLTRPVGQTLIAASVGLAFTPEALAAIAGQFWAMLAVAVLTVALSFVASALLIRLTRLDVVSACLATVPIGPVETANLAQRHGVAPGPPVFAQSMRIMLIILLVPPILVALDGGIADPSAALRGDGFEPAGAILLVVLAASAGWLLRKLRVSNPFFLGPLGASALAAAFLLPVAAMPFEIIAAAQILLGVSLGTVFERSLFRRGGGFLPAVVATMALLVVLCFLMGLGLSLVADLPWATAVLATAPGSVTEMALTAKILQEGVAMVTAYHILRIFIITPAAPAIFALTARVAARLER